jgi:serine acetyltransferase
MGALRADFARNRDPLTRLVLAVFRYGQWTTRRSTAVRLPTRIPYVLANMLFLRLGAGIDLPADLRCGPGLRLHHLGRGVTVNRGAELGANVTLFQGVAIGNVDDRGAPHIGDGVLVGAGACVLGPVVVGDGARIGAHATVLDDVPAGGLAVGPRAEVRGRRTVTP